MNIEIEEFYYYEKRVVILHVPSRPIGLPIQHKGAYWTRKGEELCAMSPYELRRIFDEAGPDFSAEICEDASIDSLDSRAIEEFRTRWIKKSGKKQLSTLTASQLLSDAELIIDNKITYASLILFGTRKALGKYLSQSEVIFEYKSREASEPAQHRKEFREGFFLFYDRLWELINLRNDVQHYRDGFFVWDIPTFGEMVIREAILNAVSHRDYRNPGSIFVRQFPRKLSVTSPGGFPTGITPENILWKQLPRNRRIAETFSRCGLVERSGQGANLMFEESIRHNKAVPDFSETDDYQVCITLSGEVRDPNFHNIS